jgi:dipeptidyl aminopeptidase/acylaminoacyl peptidase
MWGPSEPTIWHEIQYFAARGYAVVYCNPRGSGGYGRTFQAANYQNWGPGPAGDVLAAAALAIKEPYVDDERQLITGGSYGGYLTAYIITQDNRFRAAIAQRGVYDLATFYGEGLAWRLIPWQFGGPPWDPAIRQILIAQSPLQHVEKIHTPLLIKQGDNDHRVGLAQSEILYKSLKELDNPVEYVQEPTTTSVVQATQPTKSTVLYALMSSSSASSALKAPTRPSHNKKSSYRYTVSWRSYPFAGNYL